MDCQQHNDDNNAENPQESSIISNALLPVKMEEPQYKDGFLNSPIVKEEEGEHQDHMDHSDINDASPMKLLSLKESQSFGTVQRIKVRPQFIKKEAIAEEKLSIKTEINGDQFKKSFCKCTTCNLRIRNSEPMMMKLIDYVKNFPCLYDVNHENFNNANLKSVIWSNIAAECNFPNGMNASSQWNKLKTQFANILMEQKMPNISKVNQTIWEYHKEMEFVMPYITDQDVPINLEVVQEEANYSNNLQQHLPSLKRSRVSSPQLENFIKRKRDDETPSTSQSQPMDMFFASMGAMTNNLPEYLQLEVKKKVFQAVIEAEEILIAICNDQENSELR